MPKNYPEEVKLAALELFLDNKTGEQIATIVNQEFDLELKAPTIYAWAKKYDWISENASMTTKAKEIVKEKQSQRIARLQSEHLDSYEKMRKKAESELELLDFERAFEAVKAMDPVALATPAGTTTVMFFELSNLLILMCLDW